MKTDNLRLLAQQRPLVLGSGSPRRVRLLKETGVSFEQFVTNIDETKLPDEHPFECAVRLAVSKAEAASKTFDRGAVVIGGDTVVVLRDQMLDKPSDEDDAFATLRALAGHEHTVGTALALAIEGKAVASGIAKTQVRFNQVTDEQIRNYVEAGEPMDKAGAYGIQGMGAFLVDSISGELDTVIGLPRALLEDLAGQALTTLGLSNNTGQDS